MAKEEKVSKGEVVSKGDEQINWFFDKE